MSDSLVSSVTGRRFVGRGLSPRRIEGHRVCEEDGCTTVVSVYNKESKCHLHKPIRRIRIRGRSPSEIMDQDSLVVHSCRSCMVYTGVLFEESPKVLLDGIVHVQGTDGKGTFCEE